MKNKYWYVPLIVGGIISAVGIALTIIGAVMDIPSMSSDDWFEFSSLQGFFVTLGPFLIFVGLIVGISVSFSLKSSSLFGQDKDKQGEGKSVLEDRLKKVFGIEISKEEEPIYCEYCDSKLQKDETKCQSCGAKVKKSK